MIGARPIQPKISWLRLENFVGAIPPDGCVQFPSQKEFALLSKMADLGVPLLVALDSDHDLNIINELQKMMIMITLSNLVPRAVSCEKNLSLIFGCFEQTVQTQNSNDKINMRNQNTQIENIGK